LATLVCWALGASIYHDHYDTTPDVHLSFAFVLTLLATLLFFAAALIVLTASIESF
jgi:hypothetical protein